MMKTLRFSLMALGFVLAVGCTNTRITTASEYDSVYFSSKDAIGAYAQDDDNDNNRQQMADNSREDDFQYSRRLRRFGANNAVSNWRYYDPYYSNDLYYAMGTPSWSTWNNYGWYNCSSPYLGSPYGYWGYNNPYNNWGGGFYNPYCSMGNYNPWMNNYYGYNPYCIGGYYGYNPYGYYNNYYNSGYYNNYSNAGYNTPQNVWHHGSTSSFVGATAATNGGGVRPTHSFGERPSTFTRNNATSPINGSIGETPNSEVKYFKPRSNQDFNNQPPKTFTKSEMTVSPSGWDKNNAPNNPTYNNGNTNWNKNTTPPNNGGNFNKGTTIPNNNSNWNKNNSPAPQIRTNPSPAPQIKTNTSPAHSPSNSNSGGSGSFSRPSGGSSSGGSSSGGRRK